LVRGSARSEQAVIWSKATVICIAEYPFCILLRNVLQSGTDGEDMRDQRFRSGTTTRKHADSRWPPGVEQACHACTERSLIYV
jgi:hypothetical protein